MSGKVQFDKKQLPQVIVLGVMSVGCFGYFGSRMLSPTPATADGAPPAPAAAPAASAAPAAGAAATTTASTVATSFIDAPPAPGMRDPFLTTLSPVDPNAAPPVIPASPSAAPPLPHATLASLPSMSNVQPLPTASPALPPAPIMTPAQVKSAAAKTAIAQLGWMVSGTVAPYGNPSGSMAVLRNGDERSFVRVGSVVGGVYTVTLISHTGIILKGNGQALHLLIGVNPAPAAVPGAPAATPAAAGTAAAPVAPVDGTVAPTIAPVVTDTKGLGALPL